MFKGMLLGITLVFKSSKVQVHLRIHVDVHKSLAKVFNNFHYIMTLK